MPRKKKTTTKKTTTPEPTVVELQVLGVLWDHGPATARGVLERMPDGDQKIKLLERIEQIKTGDRDLYF